MEITVHRGPPVDVLLEGSDEETHPVATTTQERLCVVGGALSRERLQNRLAREGKPPSSVAAFSTVDDIAETLLSTAGEQTPVLLPESFTQRLIEEVLAQARTGEVSGPVQDLAASLPADEDGGEVAELVYEELNEYYRCTDAGSDHTTLEDIASNLDNTYARASSQRRLNQFEALTDILQDRATEIEEDQDDVEVYISRSHFVSAARPKLADHWDEAFGHTSWVGVSTISAFDNPTLRLLLEIPRQNSDVDLHFFLGSGTYNRQLTRLQSFADLTVRESSTDYPLPTDAAETLLGAKNTEATSVEGNLEFVAAPERRREVEHIAQSIRRKLDNGTAPGDIVVSARNIDLYKTHIADIFETNNLPYHLETKTPVLHAPSYRFLTATFDLIQAAVEDDEIGYDTLVDPLRMGLCLPTGDNRHWPLRDHVFLYLEQRVSDAQRRGGERTLGEWQRTVGEMSGWDNAHDRMEEFLEWIANQTRNPPQNGDELRTLVRSLISDFIFQMVPERRSRPDGPAMDSTRARLTDLHATGVAKQVYNSAAQVGTHYDYLRAVFGDTDWTPSWGEARSAIFDVLGGATMRQQHKDGNAVRIVDAGDTFFMDAEHLHLLGLSRDDFPTERQESPLLHEQLREAVVEASEDGTAPYFRLAASESQHAVDVDYYELALRVSTESITVSHQYRDTEGNAVPWSSFVDLLDLDEDQPYVTRLRADQWLPEPDSNGRASWEAVGQGISERDRTRLLQFHSNRGLPQSTSPPISEEDVEKLATFTDRDTYLDEIHPRYERFARPPWEITVDSDEPSFADTSLDEILESPISVHELDLFGQCELKFYFYQFLFNHQNDGVERQSIPRYDSSSPDYRFGELPQIIQHQYAGEQSRSTWRTIIEEEIQDRESLITRFDSRREVRDWLQNEFGEWTDAKIGPQLADEYSLVLQEADATEEISREWHWRDASTTEIDGTGVEVWQPGYRYDVFPADDNYELPIHQVRHSSYAEKATKLCHSGGMPNDECGTICTSCRNVDDCDYSTKFSLDHRVHAAPHAHDSNVGFLFQDQYEGGQDARWGQLKQGHAAAVRGDMEGGPEGNLDAGNAQLGRRQWYARQGSRDDDLESHLESFVPTDGSITYEADPQFVNQGGCESCVYRSMCAVPNAGDLE